jgi:hypothetical protein
MPSYPCFKCSSSKATLPLPQCQLLIPAQIQLYWTLKYTEVKTQWYVCMPDQVAIGTVTLVIGGLLWIWLLMSFLVIKRSLIVSYGLFSLTFCFLVYFAMHVNYYLLHHLITELVHSCSISRHCAKQKATPLVQRLPIYLRPLHNRKFLFVQVIKCTFKFPLLYVLVNALAYLFFEDTTTPTTYKSTHT